MDLHRDLFEFNDATWAPDVLRRTITEALGHAIRWGRLLDPAAAALADCLREADRDAVIDLCSGSGDAVTRLSEVCRARGQPVHVTLTDLHPRPENWKRLSRRYEGLSFIQTPVDVLGPLPEVCHGQVVSICNSLHHFSPTTLSAIFRQLLTVARGVFVVEALDGSPGSFAAMAPVGLLGLLAAPVLSPTPSLAQAVLTWGTPLALAASTWDGFVSALRTYSPQQLLEAAGTAEGWRWTSGWYRHSRGWGRGSWLAGVRS